MVFHVTERIGGAAPAGPADGALPGAQALCRLRHLRALAREIPPVAQGREKKEMRDVAIVGIGQTPVAEHWERGLRCARRWMRCCAPWTTPTRARADALFVGNMLSGDAGRPGAPRRADRRLRRAGRHRSRQGRGGLRLGRRRRCAQAMLAVGSGASEVAVAVGVEKMTEHDLHLHARTRSPRPPTPTARRQMGLSFVAINALVMQRYMHEYRMARTPSGPSASTRTPTPRTTRTRCSTFQSPWSSTQRASMMADPDQPAGLLAHRRRRRRGGGDDGERAATLPRNRSPARLRGRHRSHGGARP